MLVPSEPAEAGAPGSWRASPPCSARRAGAAPPAGTSHAPVAMSLRFATETEAADTPSRLAKELVMAVRTERWPAMSEGRSTVPAAFTEKASAMRTSGTLEGEGDCDGVGVLLGVGVCDEVGLEVGVALNEAVVEGVAVRLAVLVVLCDGVTDADGVGEALRLVVPVGVGVWLALPVGEGVGEGSRHCAVTPEPAKVFGLLHTQAICEPAPSVWKLALHVQAVAFGGAVAPCEQMVHEGAGPPAPERYVLAAQMQAALPFVAAETVLKGHAAHAAAPGTAE